jgi:hypothetical protein
MFGDKENFKFYHSNNQNLDDVEELLIDYL